MDSYLIVFGKSGYVGKESSGWVPTRVGDGELGTTRITIADFLAALALAEAEIHQNVVSN